jgi:hypothetical protein
MLDDVTYFGLRAYEETKAALEAAHPQARAAHLEMARRYDELADAIAEQEKRLEFRPTARSSNVIHDR